MQKSRTAVFDGSYLTLRELRDFVMMSCADLDGDTSVYIDQQHNGNFGVVATTKITVWEQE